MPAKRATARTARPHVDHGLSKAEACRVLQVAPSADEELMTQAYWHHATKLRVMAQTDPATRRRLDELNRAYLVLNPAQSEAPLSSEVPPPERRDDSFVADLGRWFRHIADETRRRWPDRLPEVTALIATTALLAFLALSSGASPLWTVVTAGVAALAIWSPWRRP